MLSLKILLIRGEFFYMLESSDIFEPVKIVVAEDDSFTRKLLESMFKSLGFSVRFAYDGAEGLEAFKEDMPDLVLSDYNMPKMNGLEMFKEIKKIKPDVRFVLMTIYTDSDVLIDAINLGVHRFLDKPVYKSKLEEVLNHLVNEINISKDLVRHQHLLKAYRLGVDASTVFSLLDSRGNFTYVNSNFCDLSGYPEEELIRLTLQCCQEKQGCERDKFPNSFKILKRDDMAGVCNQSI